MRDTLSAWMKEINRALRYFSASDMTLTKEVKNGFVLETVSFDGHPAFTINLNTGSVIRHPNLRYAAGCKARGIINRLPMEQRSEHYKRVTRAMNKLRPLITHR